MFKLVALAFAALALARPAAAQVGTSVRIRELERLVDSLVVRRRQATAALQAFDDSVSRAKVRMDSLRIGALEFLIEPAIRERAERAARLAIARIDSVAGAGTRLFAGSRLILRGTSGTSRDTVVVSFTLARRSEQQNVWGLATDSTLAQWIYDTALLVLGESLDAATMSWQNARVRPESVTTNEWIATRLDVVSSATTVAHRCYEGELASCRIALGLVPVTDWVTQWYDAADRRRVVSTRRGRTQDADVSLCAEGSDAACIAVMRGIRFPGDAIYAHRRTTLVRTAIQMGGRAGFERYLTARGTHAERLAITAAAPLDSVLSVWVRNVRETRRPSLDVSPSIAMASLGWVLVCGMLSLRSSRWR